MSDNYGNGFGYDSFGYDEECDNCHKGMNGRGWIVYTGVYDQKFHVPVVKFVCQECFSNGSNGR